MPPAAPHYSFRKGFRSAIDPAVLAARIEWLRVQLGRAPNGADVLEDARPIGSPLHDHFEWGDAVAAEHFRIHQAKELVSALRVTFVKHEESHFAPAFISQMGDMGTRGYIPIQMATAPPLRERTLADVIRRYWLTASRDRELGYEELEPLFEVLDGLYAAHCV